MKQCFAALLGLAAFALAPVAHAGEGLFSRVYTVETVPGGHYEVEEILRHRRDRAFGDYSAFDERTEFEYGITDNLQAALYLNAGYVHAAGAPDDDIIDGSKSFSQDQGFVQGVSGEFIYRALSPVTDPVGLAFYIEPEIHFYDPHNGRLYDRTFGTEYRVLLQKDFWDDSLILAYNMVVETEFIRFAQDENWKSELDWNNELGLTYRFAANWFAGGEYRNHNELNGMQWHEHSVHWVGPVVHYGGPKFWGTLGALVQVYGNPSGTDDTGTPIGGDHLFLRSHERYEFTAKIGIPF